MSFVQIDTQKIDILKKYDSYVRRYKKEMSGILGLARELGKKISGAIEKGLTVNPEDVYEYNKKIGYSELLFNIKDIIKKKEQTPDVEGKLRALDSGETLNYYISSSFDEEFYIIVYNTYLEYIYDPKEQ